MGFEYVSRLHLPDLFHGGSVREFLHDAAHVGGDRFVEFTVLNTPVRTGNLRTSWYQKPVTVAYTSRGELAYESGVATDVDYAPFVEHGTGIWGPEHSEYEIRPKNPDGVLRFMVHGQVVFAKSVWHPGSPGNHMIAIAANLVESQLDEFLRPALMRWKEAQENGAGLRLIAGR